MQKRNCLNCQKEFIPNRIALLHERNNTLRSSNEGKFCSLACSKVYINNHKLKKPPNVVCSYCGEEFYKNISKQSKSKSGLFFCCREHKALAQRIEFGLQEVWPGHYTNGMISRHTYREFYLRNTSLTSCEKCGYSKIFQILQIHHKDKNQENNELSNLILLCPTCHVEEHYLDKSGLYHNRK